MEEEVIKKLKAKGYKLKEIAVLGKTTYTSLYEYLKGDMTLNRSMSYKTKVIKQLEKIEEDVKPKKLIRRLTNDNRATIPICFLEPLELIGGDWICIEKLEDGIKITPVEREDYYIE